MAAPTETHQVIELTVAADTIPSTREIKIQSMFAKAAAVVTDGDGENIWEATAAGQWVNFPCGILVKGLNATGTGPVYVYTE